MKTLIIDIIFTMLMLLICSIMLAIHGEWLMFSLSFTMFIFDIVDIILDYKKWKEKNKNEPNHTL